MESSNLCLVCGEIKLLSRPHLCFLPIEIWISTVKIQTLPTLSTFFPFRTTKLRIKDLGLASFTKKFHSFMYVDVSRGSLASLQVVHNINFHFFYLLASLLEETFLPR